MPNENLTMKMFDENLIIKIGPPRYEPLNKFMLVKHSECPYLAHPLRVFEMIVTPDLDYPLVCVDVARPDLSSNYHLHLSLIDLNTG